MPIQVPLPYNTLLRVARKGEKVPYAGICPGEGCTARESFAYTGKCVKRGAALIEAGTVVYCTILIALAQCKQCGRFARVLPIEILPRKIYGMQVIEAAMRFYVLTADSLRKAASLLPTNGQRYLWHTTLNRWLTGFGEKILDRHDEIQRRYPPPATALLSTAGKKSGISLGTLFLTATLFLAPVKYHTQRRKDQLLAVGRLLTVATRAYAKETASTLMSWAVEAIPAFNAVVWDFPCFYSVTSLRQAHPP